MSPEVKDVEVDLLGNKRIPARFLIWGGAPENPDMVKLTVQYNGKEITSTGSDYFSAMCSIRRVLEQEGGRLLCYGASKNVYPSGMSRSMGAARKAYKHTMGSQGKQSDLVCIFDAGPDMIPATVGEQEEFFQNWIKSLGSEKA